jgi:hypothetical protein
VSGCVSGWRFEAGSARAGAGAEIPHFSKTARSETPASREEDPEVVVAVGPDVGDEGLVSGTGAGRVVCLAPGLASGFTSGFASELEAALELRFSQLKLVPEVAARLAAMLGLDWGLTFASRIEIDPAPALTLIVTLGCAFVFAPTFSPNFAPAFASEVEVVAEGDGLGVSSGAELDMEVASLAPKLAGADDAGANAGGRVAVEAAGVAAGMEIASTCIAVPRVRLHSTRQWRESGAGWEGARQGLHFQELAKARPALMKNVKWKEE